MGRVAIALVQVGVRFALPLSCFGWLWRLGIGYGDVDGLSSRICSELHSLLIGGDDSSSDTTGRFGTR